MASLPEKSDRRQYNDASEWPTWTDDLRYTLTNPEPDDAGPYEPPSDADEVWAAEHLNDEDDQADDAIIDQAAAETEARDRIDRGTLM